MAKSKHRGNHKERVNKYKTRKKIEQEALKKKMLDNYIKMQQQMLADKEAHTSTQEVSGPEVNIDELNTIENWNSNPIVDVENIVDVEEIVVESSENAELSANKE